MYQGAGGWRLSMVSLVAVLRQSVLLCSSQAEAKAGAKRAEPVGAVGAEPREKRSSSLRRFSSCLPAFRSQGFFLEFLGPLSAPEIHSYCKKLKRYQMPFVFVNFSVSALFVV